VLRARVFAIYSKPGGLSDAGAFTRADLVVTATTVGQVTPLLARGAAMGDSPEDLATALDAMTGRTEVQAAGSVEAKLATAVGLAQSDPELASVMGVLARRFHSVSFAMGRAWARSFAPGLVTLEVREVDLVTGADRFVVARVFLPAGQPTALPPPDAPVRTAPTSSADHLRAGLLWSEPEALRRRSPLVAGFDLWRLPAAAARERGLDTRAPSLDELTAIAQRVNNLPIVPRRHLTAAEATVAAADSANAFLHDSGPSNPPWADGDEFAWVAVARDRLGIPGEPSKAGFGFVCAMMPPAAPRGVVAENTFTPGVVGPAEQGISVRWQSSPDEDPITRYEIFKGESELPPVVSTNELPVTLRVAEIPFEAGVSNFAWIDPAIRPRFDTNFFGKGFWYALRSVRETQCGAVASPLTPPVWVNVRRYDAPDAPGGELGIHCPRVVVRQLEPPFQIEPLATPAPRERAYRFVVQRRDRDVAWLEITIETGVDTDPDVVSPQLRFGAQDDEVRFEFSLPPLGAGSPVPIARVVAGSFHGGVSDPLVMELPLDPPSDLRMVAGLMAATVSTANPQPGDPFLEGVLSGPFILSDVGRRPDGTLVVRSPNSSGEVLVQAAAVGSTQADWRMVTITRPFTVSRTDGPWLVFRDSELPPDAEIPRTYIYRAWLIDPQRVPAEEPCIHVARPADSDLVVPIKVRMALTPRSKLWRMYRQVDGGELTLFAEGAGEFVPSSVGSIVEGTDDAMPPAGARLCYFGQVADENGNWSPLGPLGCEDVPPAQLPVPLLAKPEPEGDIFNPVMRLRWFCPPDGVSRFRIILKPIAGKPVEQGQSLLTAELKTVAISGAKPTAWSSVDAVTAIHKSLVVLTSFSTGPVGTERLASGLGPGPDFTYALDVEPGGTYEVQVAAVDARGHVGYPSHIQRFTWTVPRPIVDRDVPWPQRPLPAVSAIHSNVTAVWLGDSFMVWPGSATDYPMGVRIGRIFLGRGELIDEIGSIEDGEHGGRRLRMETVRQAAASGRRLESFLFSDEASEVPRPEFRPINVVLYRQQVPSPEFPEVSGTVVQVSSLLREIAAWPLPNQEGFELLDPAVGMTLHIPDQNLILNPPPPFLDLHLLDLHPVVRGARYRYWLVHFTPLGEPDQTIPAGERDVPL
jgi:hypothetical protein